MENRRREILRPGSSNTSTVQTRVAWPGVPSCPAAVGQSSPQNCPLWALACISFEPPRIPLVCGGVIQSFRTIDPKRRARKGHCRSLLAGDGCRQRCKPTGGALAGKRRCGAARPQARRSTGRCLAICDSIANNQSNQSKNAERERDPPLAIGRSAADEAGTF